MYVHSELRHKPKFQTIGVRWVRGDAVKLDEVTRMFQGRKAEIGLGAKLVNPDKRLGISIHHGELFLVYYMAMEVMNIQSVPEGMVAMTVPAHHYAVHTYEGSTDAFWKEDSDYYSRGNQWMKEQGYEALISKGVPWFEEFDQPEFAPGQIVRFKSNVPVYKLVPGFD